MKVLLLGNPSMMHSHLSQGLRSLGHEVTLVSQRYGWRSFTGQDILLERRRDINSKLAFLLYLWQVIRLLPRWRGYDVVQLSHCGFLELRGWLVIPFYRYLRRHNRKVVLCSCDVDYHILDQIENHQALRYSEFQIGTVLRHNADVEPLRRQYTSGWNTGLSRHVSEDCDAIVPVLYEYWTCYDRVYPEKTHFIPLPVKMPNAAGRMPNAERDRRNGTAKLKLFLGLQRDRMQIKGTDILLRAAKEVARDYPELCELRVVENVPYTEYEKTMNDSDILIDQLYSYTPAMNALTAMSKGLVVVGGGEPENYEILHEEELRPIINVLPTYEDVYATLTDLVRHPERIPELKQESIEYVRRHHDHLKVARQYEALYRSLL